MRILSASEVKSMHTSLIETFGGTPGIQSEALLESAINAPFQTFGGVDLYPSILEKAARLCFCLVCDHPFVDGNKRIGAHAMMVFLEINEVANYYTNEALVVIIEKLAAREIEYEDLLLWLKDSLEFASLA